MTFVSRTQFHIDNVLNVKAVVAAFNQEKALVGAFSVIVQLHRLVVCSTTHDCVACSHHIHGCCAVINSIKCLSYPLYMKNTDITSLIFCGTIMNNNLLFFTPTLQRDKAPTLGGTQD